VHGTGTSPDARPAGRAEEYDSVVDGPAHVTAGPSLLLEAGVVLLVALVVRLIDLGHPPFIDELNHLLAAGSLLEDGTLRIADGLSYDRGVLFTYLVAGAMAVFGGTLEAARLPAVLSGALLVVLVFVWLRAESGRVAAWTTAMLLCFAPLSLYLSQWVRFYTLHALFFWAATWAAYQAVNQPDPARRRWLLAGGSLALYAAAFQLQVTTVIGMGGLALYAVLIEGPRRLLSLGSPARRWAALGIALLAGLTLATAASLTGATRWLAQRAGQVDVWAVGRADNIRFYHSLFTDQYGFLWVLMPLAALVALARRWRLALLFACVFVGGILVHSIAAWKAERYVFYLFPAWFALWGIAAAEVLPAMWSRVSSAARELLGGRARLASAVAALALIVASVLPANSIAAFRATRLIYVQRTDWTPPLGFEGERYRGHPDWEAVEPVLDPLAESVDVVIGEPDLKVIYYLGDVDHVLYAGYLLTVRDGRTERALPEFATWAKVGRPLISEPQSIEAIVACNATGLIVAEQHVWGWDGGVPRHTADYIERVATPVALPAGSGVLAFRWQDNAGAWGGEAPDARPSCDEIRRARDDAARAHAPTGARSPAG
jgi:4-amino-4-deoxy-L-arabinose transferase-like glycosyltransferase